MAVIMDGNGRWAQKRHLPRIAGHRAGTRSARTTIETCARLKIEALTLYAFSVENWRRPKAEIDFLMQLLREYLRKEMPLLQKNNIRMRFLGRIEELPAGVQNDVRDAMEKTAGNKGMVLCVALNYGGRAEIVDAMNAILAERNGHGAPDKVTEAQLSRHLYTDGLPDPGGNKDENLKILDQRAAALNEALNKLQGLTPPAKDQSTVKFIVDHLTAVRDDTSGQAAALRAGDTVKAGQLEARFDGDENIAKNAANDYGLGDCGA